MNLIMTIMSKHIRKLLLVVFIFMTCTNSANAQEFYIENPEAMRIFQDLNRIFPRRYLTMRDIGRCEYWINYVYENQEDFEKHKAQIWHLFARLNALPTIHKYTEEIDSANVQCKNYSMTFPTKINGQEDYLSFSTNTRRLRFYFTSKNRMIDRNADLVTDQKVIDELENLFNEYVSRKKVEKEEVRYRGKTNYCVYESFPPYTQRGDVSGNRFIVAGCSERDYRRFYDLFHQYVKKDHVLAVSNDVYWDYDECAVRVRQSNGKPLFIGAAFKENKLYLIRAEGCPNGTGLLPRAWAEDNPIWETAEHMGGKRHSKR